TIVNDDPLPRMSINDVSVIEGNSGATGAVLTVSLSEPSGRPVTVIWVTADGTANAIDDYVAVGGGLTFAPGETTKAVVVQVLGDELSEADETIAVNLRSVINATLTKAKGVVTILNDELPPMVSIQDAGMVEVG